MWLARVKPDRIWDLITARGSRARALIHGVKAPLRNAAIPLLQYWYSSRYHNHTYSPFVTIGTPRVGSTLVMTHLRSHPKIVSYPEIFLGQYLANHPYAIENPTRFLNRYIFRPYPDWVQAVGFKLFYDQAISSIALENRYLKTGGYQNQLYKLDRVRSFLGNKQELKVIHLKRWNLLKSLLSRKRAEETKQWLNAKKSFAKPNPKILLEYEETLGHFEKIEREQEGEKALFSRHECLEIEYEDMRGDIQGTIRKIQKFLRVEEKDLKSPLHRQGGDRLSEAISNYRELKDRFQDTHWSPFFED